MCKRINRFIPVLFVSSIVLTILAGAVIAVTGLNIIPKLMGHIRIASRLKSIMYISVKPAAPQSVCMAATSTAAVESPSAA